MDQVKWFVLGVLIALVFPVLAIALSSGEASGLTLVDRIVATVDDDPIFFSDIRRLIDLGLAERDDQESERQLERRVLEGLIEQKLRLHEIERYDFHPVPEAEMERQLGAVQSSFKAPGSFERRLLELGLGEEGLRQLLGRQLRVLAYIEERLGPKILVGFEDIQTYYESELLPALDAQGVGVPELSEVQEAIGQLLREVRFNEEIELWTLELRLQAEIVDFLERPGRELPPVRERYDLDGG
jgi:hypothetical protein